ncbi:MAG: rRNA maturation RNase YbeY [Anaerolineales bacterium]|jgi:probable rRNA maturation factor
MITLEISKRYQSQIDTSLIKQTVDTALIHQGVRPDSEISIIITGDEQLHALNLQFLDVDAPTDVLSFPVDFTNPDTDIPYLGDILISFPRAETQASAAGHTVMAELQLLVVHGILHLLGHDHAENAEKVKMWNAQRGILQQLGLGNLKLPNGVNYG